MRTAQRADIPLTMDADVSEVVIFETRFMVARVVAREWGVDQYAVNGPCGINLVTEFSTLEG